MSDDSTIAAVTVPFFLFGLPVLAWTVFRLLAHRERMAMIERGLVPPGKASANWEAAAPRSVRPSDVRSADSAQCLLRKGITVAFIGFAITIGLSFIGYRNGPLGSYLAPGPWLLGGLIPMFAGVAQILIALLSGATLRPIQPNAYFGPAPHAAPPPPPPPSGGPIPTYEGSYTYRPGSQQELRPPAPPPDRT